MYRYGKVVFRKGGETGARLQKTLIERLDNQGVITVPKATIEKWYESDRQERVGCVHSYALHNKEEADIFKTIMESAEMQDESVKWKITRFDHDREFLKWAQDNEYFIDQDGNVVEHEKEEEKKQHGRGKKV